MLYLYLRRVQFYYYDNMTSHLFELSSFHLYQKSLSQFLVSRDLNYFLFISDEAENLWVSIYSEQSEQYFPTEFKPCFW